ncbi:putative transcription factor interactor and regulator C3H-WRC/GRF family [Helianthus annuus]|uniref:Transcription factor interactor and regulator C3H-WRC/GRF family n=1 Tax=Helianthus annuus TaxID=4232 RepID=A0A9K3DH25_HELAN|nr:putative transcription factor interactor and regulator C3H-WRC/GRF family [Helianthus annuus]KAJ0428999.1 putative transcription factor interactor and regulator C3H-WRC/GRF family [Helianthus annuus]KAJ0812984.1 putative transcription factor interactor and regulator C3H-WRC/GRF family [Helianthus annuus]
MEGVRVEVLKCRDTPMDYDDNEFSIHNVDLTEEGSSTVSPVLRPYDFDDGGHLSFDSLVENEVFLGITGQEDNQWIEEYSRGTSSSVVESRRDNVWSEAASSESVEMLLKSVGQGTLVTVSSDEPTNMDRNLKQDDESNHAQEAMVTDKEDEGALATEEPDVIDEPCSVSINPDPNLKQEDENNHTQEAIVTNEEDGALVTEQLDVGDDMDPNLKQDDGNGHAHEARVMSKEVGALVNEEIDASDDPCDLDTDVDRDLKQDDGNNHAHEAMILNKPQDQEEAKVSGGELDSDVIGNKCDLSEEKDDGICDDVNHEARDTVVELSENNLQEHSTSKIECGNLDASNECNLKKCSSSNECDCSTENMDDSIGSQTAHENCTNSDLLMTEACAEVSRDSKCAVTAFSAEPELNNDLMHEDSPAVAVKDDDKTKSENPAYVKSNVVSDLQSRYVEESEKPDSVCDPSELFCEGSSVNDVGIDMTNTWSSPKVITENTDLVASPKVHSENSNKDHNPAAKLSGSVAQQVNDEIQSSEQDGGMCIDRNLTFHEEGNASLPLDIDIAALDSQQNVESVLSPEGCKTQGSEADITILAEPVAAVKSDMVSSSDTKDRVHLHSKNVASSVHHYNEEKKEERFVGDGTCEYESLKAVGSMVDCASLSSVETGASPDRAGDGVLETSVENMNANMNDLAEETVDPVPCDSSAKVCDKVEAGGGMQESISGHHVNISIEQHTSTDVGLTSEYDDSHTRHEKDGSVSMDKIESVSPLIITNDDELSQSTRVEPSEGAISENTSLPEVTEDMVLTAECNDSSVYVDKLQSVSSVLKATGEGAINENTPLPEATEDVAVALTSECNDSQMRHDEDSSVSMDKLQSVSPLSDTNNTELSENTRVTSSEGAIDENTTLPEATKDVVLTSECDDGHMRHEEDGSVSEDKLQSVSLLLNANDTELSRSTGKTHNVGGINKNTSLPKAAEDVALTSECNYGHIDKLQSVSPLLNTNNTELSPNTSVKSSDSAVNENTPLPDAADNVLTTECDDSHMRNEEDSSVSPLLYTNNTEPSQSARVEPNDVAINENNSLPVPDVVLTSEGDDSHKEDSSVSMDKLQSVSPLLNTNNTEPSQSTRVNSGDGAIIENTALPEAEDVVRISECDDNHVRHEEGKLQSVSPLLDTNNTELSQSTRVGPSEGAINETASLPEATEDVQGKEQSISSNSDMKTDNSFTFEVSGTAGLTETCKGLQLFPASQSSNLSTTTEVPCIDSNKPIEDPAVTLQTPGSGTVITGGKERKTRRKSVGKESATKSKETTTIRQGRVKKSSPLTVTTPQSPPAAAAGHAIQFQELGSKEKSSPLPDLNNATCIFHQPFTDNQQVQLRAQILVYGSLISGMPPEEPHMIAAFGQSDAERKTWKDAWHACLNRDNGQKSHANTPRSDLKDLGLRTPDLGIKHSSPPAVSPLIPVPSPLWNMSTPSSVGFLSRSAAFQQPFAPIHPPTYHTPPNPLWLSQSPFFGQWGVASSPASTAARFSGLPITEAVKLTPVKFSGCGPHTYSVPVVHSALFSSQSTDGKNASGESKSRKRKKVTADVSTVMTPSAHPRIPFLVENQTDSVTTPVVTSIFSTSVTVSTPPASKSNRKVEEANVQEADVNATKTRQPSSTSRSTKRTKVTTSASVNQTPVSTQASEISLLAQNQTISVPAPALCTPFPTSVAMSTPGYRNAENALAVEETLSEVKKSKLQAENAALLAAAEVSNCQDVWSGLDRENNSGVVSDAEAKLMSSISAATTVAKMASAAAKIASNVAEQAKLMADEVFQSGKSETFSHVSHPSVVNKATPASILKSVDKSHETTDSYPNSIISAAREAARRRIEAASAASKHAENLDAIVKAAELAAEAVSQVGKIVAMSDSSALRKLAEAGPEGFWKISPLAYEQHQGGKNNIPDVFNEEDTKAVGVSTATNTRSPHTYAGHRIPQHISGIWEEHNIKEGCLVEVYKENGKCKGAWLAANVLSLKDEKALVCYTNIQSSDEGSDNVKEWVAFEVEGIEEVPRIRIAHPMTTMRFEGSRKRRRTAVTDYAWSKGDRVDVWMHDCWREGIVVEPNKIDVTFLTVQFPAQGETSIVRSWHVRPTLIWKDRKWIEWNGGRASQGEAPKEKRMKLGSPDVNDTRKDKLPMIAEVGMHEEKGSLLPILSAKESCFNVGKGTDKPSGNLRTIQKDKARVVFGVPKPGKKQKFMAVSTQYVDGRSEKSNKNNTTNGSLKFSKPPGARGSKNDAMENQAIETKSRLLKSRKPPVPSFRTTTSRDSELSDADSVENASSRQNQTQVGSSSNKRRDPAKGPLPKKAFTFTSKPKSEQFNRGKLQVAPKVEVKNTSISQVNEPRRSNRKIQPTSRLLEGLQSSLTISKIPSVSHAVRRNVTTKGSTSHGTS